MGRCRIKPTDVSGPEDPKSLESRLRVVVEALNVRRTPSLGGRIVGQAPKGRHCRGQGRISRRSVAAGS
jgi:hypothetical protein